MNKNLIKTASFWITLGVLSGVLFLNFSFSKGLPDILESTSPSVVNIWSIKKWKAWQEKSSLLGMKRWRQVIKTGFVPNGSGVIVSKDGKIITNFHVINDAFKNNQKLVVEFSNGDTSEAVIVGFDLDADVAVIKIISEKIFSPIKLSDFSFFFMILIVVSRLGPTVGPKPST